MRLLACAAALVVAAASPTTAQARFELTPFWGLGTLNAVATRAPGGRALPFDERFEKGFELGARFDVHLASRWTVEAEYRYSPNGGFEVSFDDPILGALDLEVPIDADSHAVIGRVLFTLIDTGRFRPFAAAGFGAEHFRARPDSETSLRVDVGGGATISLRPGLGLRFDVRYVAFPDFFLTEASEGAAELDVGLAIGF